MGVMDGMVGMVSIFKVYFDASAKVNLFELVNMFELACSSLFH